MTRHGFSRYFGNMRGYNLRRGLMICGLIDGNPFKPDVLSRLFFSMHLPMLDFGYTIGINLSGEFTSGVKYLIASFEVTDPCDFDEFEGEDRCIKHIGVRLFDNRKRIKRRRERLQIR